MKAVGDTLVFSVLVVKLEKKMIVKTKLTRTYREWKILSLIFQGESRI